MRTMGASGVKGSTGKGHEESFSVMEIISLDLGDGYVGVRSCQNVLKWTPKTCAF